MTKTRLTDYPELVTVARYNAKRNETSVAEIQPLFNRRDERVLSVLMCACHNEPTALVAQTEQFLVVYANGMTEKLDCLIFGISHGYRAPRVPTYLFHPTGGWEVSFRRNNVPSTLWEECDDLTHALSAYRDITGSDLAKLPRFTQG